MKNTVMVATLLASFVFANELPENVLGENCLKDYQTKYLKIQEHKSFAFGREKASGKVGCGWSYGYENIEKTKAMAVKQCAKYVSGSQCHVVDVDGKFMSETVKLTQFLSKDEEEKVIAIAKSTVKGNCLPFFRNYLKNRDYKVFAYALDKDGKYACGKTYNHNNLKSAQTVALKSCQKNKIARGKEGPKSSCKIYAEGNTILVQQFFSKLQNKEVSELLKLSKVTSKKFDLHKNIEKKSTEVKVKTLAKTLQMTAKTLSKNLPEMLDEELRFDKVKAEGSKMIFEYTLVHYNTKTMSPRKLESLMYKEIEQQVCKVPESILLLKRGMKIDYNYRGVDMKKIATFSFDAKKCSVR